MSKVYSLYISIPKLYRRFALIVLFLALAIYVRKHMEQPYTADLIGEPEVIINNSSYGYEPLRSAPPSNKNTGTLYDYTLDKVIGKSDAPITIVEYSSFFCPHCRTFNDNMAQLKKDYIDTGKVKYAKRMVVQNETLPAVLLTHCVGDDNYFTIVSDLYATANVWSNRNRQKNELKKIALKNGLTEEQFNTCIANKDLSEKLVKRQNNDVKELKLYSTPTIYINNDKIMGSISYTELKNKIEKLLKK